MDNDIAIIIKNSKYFNTNNKKMVDDIILDAYSINTILESITSLPKSKKFYINDYTLSVSLDKI